MMDLFQITVITVAIVIVAAFLLLLRAHIKLRQGFWALTNSLNLSHNDIAGLCSAALTVNSRITATEEQLSELLAAFEEHQQNHFVGEQPVGSSDTSYSAVLEKVRGGASVNELVQHCGLSHDEAALLIRLHGTGTAL